MVEICYRHLRTVWHGLKLPRLNLTLKRLGENCWDWYSNIPIQYGQVLLRMYNTDIQHNTPKARELQRFLISRISVLIPLSAHLPRAQTGPAHLLLFKDKILLWQQQMPREPETRLRTTSRSAIFILLLLLFHPLSKQQWEKNVNNLWKVFFPSSLSFHETNPYILRAID